MALQMILCMETGKKAATDYVYISATIRHFYALDNKIKISTVYMNGKMQYKSKDVLDQIRKWKKDYSVGDSRVIYCIDTDRFDIDAQHAREFREISQFCAQNGFDLIWFCHDVEDVYLGEKIQDSKKVDAAAEFKRKSKIRDILADHLSSDQKKAHFSNIMLVLDKYLKRK